MPSSSSRWQPIYGLTLVCLVAVIGWLFAIQGWKSRFLTFDLLPHIRSAGELLERGRIPDRGCLSRYASHIPPGTTWLLAPGLVLFEDPRLYEYIGTGILYLGTLIGIFLLARTYFGMQCALLAAALYGLSQLGLHFASSLWPRGHPFFYVWMIYFTDRWVREKSAKYLAAVLLTWGAGMYVFMEIAPTLFVLPVVWLLHRPPVRLRPLIFGGVVILAIWYPYLRFEAGRHFIDLRSQVQRKYILPLNYKDTWCNSNATLELWTGQTFRSFRTFESRSQEPIEDKSVSKIWSRLLVPARGVTVLLLANFQRITPIPGAGLILALLVAGSLALLSLSESSLDALRRFGRSRSKLIGWGLITCAALGNEFLLARCLAPDGTLAQRTLYAIRMMQIVLLLGGMVVLMRRFTLIGRLFDRALEYARTAGSGVKPSLLVISLVIPWLILLLVVDPSWAPRLFWLWPLQVIFLAASVTYLPLKLRIARPLIRMSQILLALILFGNSLLLSRVNSWFQSGYAGSDPERIRAVDYIAARIRSQGRMQASIGYQIVTSAYMPALHILDPQYKVGAEYDFYFKQRHGILNTDRCAEGASPEDEYQIVQSVSGGPEDYRFPFFPISQTISNPRRDSGHIRSSNVVTTIEDGPQVSRLCCFFVSSCPSGAFFAVLTTKTRRRYETRENFKNPLKVKKAASNQIVCAAGSGPKRPGQTSASRKRYREDQNSRG